MTFEAWKKSRGIAPETYIDQHELHETYDAGVKAERERCVREIIDTLGDDGIAASIRVKCLLHDPGWLNNYVERQVLEARLVQHRQDFGHTCLPEAGPRCFECVRLERQLSALSSEKKERGSDGTMGI